MSAKMEALALLAKPCQGECLTPRRHWSALRPCPWPDRTRALSVAQAPNAQFPRGRADLEVTSETDVAIWEDTIDDDGTAAREIWMLVGTIGGDKGEDSLGVRGRIVEEDIR
jgi:hypothetical protein